MRQFRTHEFTFELLGEEWTEETVNHLVSPDREKGYRITIHRPPTDPHFEKTNALHIRVDSLSGDSAVIEPVIARLLMQTEWSAS